MEPDELVATADSPLRVDEKTASCAAFTASVVPPNPDIEKESPAVVLLSATSMGKESDKTPNA